MLFDQEKNIVKEAIQEESFHGKTTTGGTMGRKLAKSVFFVVSDTILRKNSSRAYL
jgi:hypothetical protein